MSGSLIGNARRFEFCSGSSQKFWEISRQGSELMVRFGRIGTAGQSQTKTYPDSAAAAKHLENLIRQKTGKSYYEAR
jgi:predicted DNA-binding WGR domain protein